ncbi:MAG: sulfatase-like hydrolase/transferase [Leptospirales bacterium]|nr:sulfatase-like hydrolase/transferase [Leptospirales bacterium]HMU83350.1 sulfatase-like hydrolase/transferase [Leptospiraceae bacterium]HMZ36057.1 sulfatase-like hydrolase/transferase [Leptospiraceae bacterium]HNE23076.1 sulfatase-like hydrolase/transferase [Leptospiraceae bacterium]HNJ03861.1 sulfatase-like hydrolase/transferase [Leptospiraceae bacterium]
MRSHLTQIALFILILDLITRRKVVQDFHSREWMLYVASWSAFLIFLHLSVFFAKLLLREGRRFMYASFLISVSLWLAIGTSVSTVFYFTNGIAPNLFSAEFALREPYNAWTLLRDTASFAHLMWIVCGAALVFHLLKRATTPAPPTPGDGKAAPDTAFEKTALRTLRKGILPAALSLLFMIMVHNVQFYEQCYVPITGNIVILLRSAWNRATNTQLWSRGFTGRNPIQLSDTHEHANFHLLIILNESLRKKGMQIYGGQRQNTPYMQSLKDSGQIILFSRAYANATSTYLSLPSILTGINPVQETELTLTYPNLFEYAKAAGQHTYYISSHKLSWGRMSVFIKTPALEKYWAYEESGAALSNDLGINDLLTLAEWKKHIRETIQNGETMDHQRTAGMLHFNTTHYPYNVEPEFSLYSGTSRDSYDNTIYKTDALVQEVFKQLTESAMIDRTIVVFASDHGEAFGEHECVAHFYCQYLETVQVPLWIYVPKALQNKLDMQQLKKTAALNVSNVDLIPTIIGLYGMDSSSQISSLKKRFLGSDLFKAVKPDRTILITTSNEMMRTDVGASIIQNNQQYLLKLARPAHEELYSFDIDPEENHSMWETTEPEARQTWHKWMDSQKATFEIRQRFRKATEHSTK